MKYTRDIVLTVLGWAFILVGIIGLLLPLLHGFLFLIIGLYLLSVASPKAHAKLHATYVAFKIRFPRIAFSLAKVEKKWEDMIHRWRNRS
ncbi:MAG: PGPGW domain-containing protein [bacterium]|nr:PGPGW domain-containing protein [bacterium]